MYHLVRFFIACAVMGILVSAGPAVAQGIHFVEYFGKGCPHGPIAQSISAERKVATLHFEFDVFSVFPEEPKKECTLFVILTEPGQARVKLVVHWYANGREGVTVEERQTYLRGFHSRTGGERFEGPGELPDDFDTALRVDAHSRGSKVPFFFVDLELELKRPPFSTADGFGVIKSLVVTVEPK